MSFNAASLRIMAAKGLTIEDVAEIAEAMEAQRSPAAVRQARYRSRKRGVTNGDVTRDVTRPPIEEIRTPVSPVEPNGSTAPKGRGEKIPDSWQPPPIGELSPEAQSMASQWPAAAYRAEGEAFVNFWAAESGKTARKLSWNRAWANRIVTIHSRVMRDWRSRDGPSGDLDVLMASVERKYATNQ